MSAISLPVSLSPGPLSSTSFSQMRRRKLAVLLFFAQYRCAVCVVRAMFWCLVCFSVSLFAAWREQITRTAVIAHRVITWLRRRRRRLRSSSGPVTRPAPRSIKIRTIISTIVDELLRASPEPMSWTGPSNCHHRWTALNTIIWTTTMTLWRYVQLFLYDTVELEIFWNGLSAIIETDPSSTFSRFDPTVCCLDRTACIAKRGHFVFRVSPVN